MIKKKYMQPALEISQAVVEQIVAVSMRAVHTDGLDDDLSVDNDDLDGNPWEEAW